MKRHKQYVVGKTFVFLAVSTLLMLPSGQVSKRTLASLKKDLSAPHSTSRALTDMGAALSQLARMNLAVAGSPATVNVTNLLRGSLGMVIGYGDRDSYISLVCDGVDPGSSNQCDGPPLTGIAGATAIVLNGLTSIAHDAGINSCTDVPASGSVTGHDALGNAWSFTFQSPSHSIPANWTNGGAAFSKRALIDVPHAVLPVADTDFKVAFEFNCGDLDTASYVAINMPMTNATGYTRLITLFQGKVSSTTKGIETYLAEYNPTSTRIRGATAIRIEYQEATSTFQLASVLGNGGIELPDHSQGIGFIGRVLASGNYSTHQTSILMDGIAKDSLSGDPDGAFDVSAIESGFATQVAATGLTNGTGATPAHTLGADLTGGGTSVPADSTELYYRGCVDLDTPDSSPADDSTCSGLDLIAPSVGTYVGSGGVLSIQWVLDHIGGAQEVL